MMSRSEAAGSSRSARAVATCMTMTRSVEKGAGLYQSARPCRSSGDHEIFRTYVTRKRSLSRRGASVELRQRLSNRRERVARGFAAAEVDHDHGADDAGIELHQHAGIVAIAEGFTVGIE